MTKVCYGGALERSSSKVVLLVEKTTSCQSTAFYTELLPLYFAKQLSRKISNARGMTMPHVRTQTYDQTPLYTNMRYNPNNFGATLLHSHLVHASPCKLSITSYETCWAQLACFHHQRRKVSLRKYALLAIGLYLRLSYNLFAAMLHRTNKLCEHLDNSRCGNNLAKLRCASAMSFVR